MFSDVPLGNIVYRATSANFSTPDYLEFCDTVLIENICPLLKTQLIYQRILEFCIMEKFVLSWVSTSLVTSALRIFPLVFVCQRPIAKK